MLVARAPIMPLHLPVDQLHELVGNYPTPDTIEHLYDEQDLQRTITTYRFFYPTVSAEAIFRGNRALGARDGKEMVVLIYGPGEAALDGSWKPDDLVVA